MSTKSQSESPKATSPIFNIVGDRVALGPLRKDLIPTYLRWFNDFRTLRTMLAMPVPLTLEQEEKWYERANTRGGHRYCFYHL